ncbi:MAG: sugar ABC transporter permease [Acidimicrobiales bacterium]
MALRISRRRTPTWRWLGPMAPALGIMGLFFAGPIIWSVYIAFTNKALTGVGAAHAKWVGFANFTQMFQDPLFIHSLVLTAIFVIGSAIIGQNTLGFLIALLERGKNSFVTRALNTFIIAAWVMPEIVAGFCWYAFLYQGGTLDTFLQHFGLSQDWLYTTPMLAIIIANIWRGTAFSMLVYSAGLSDVPAELLEAAKVDGASQLSLLRLVIIPLLRRSIVTNLMLITLQTLASFTLIFVLTAGGPGEASQTTPLYIYQQALQLYDISYGTAMCIVLLLIGALFSVVYIKLIRVEEVG